MDSRKVYSVIISALLIVAVALSIKPAEYQSFAPLSTVDSNPKNTSSKPAFQQQMTKDKPAEVKSQISVMLESSRTIPTVHFSRGTTCEIPVPDLGKDRATRTREKMRKQFNPEKQTARPDSLVYD